MSAQSCWDNQKQPSHVFTQDLEIVMALLLTEQHVTELLDMQTALDAVEEVLRHQAEGAATNRPRYRVAAGASQLHVLAAGDSRLGVYGLKSYTVSRKGARFLVLLYEAESGDLLAIIEADRLGQMRTGAASGIATKVHGSRRGRDGRRIWNRLAGRRPVDGHLRRKKNQIN